MFCKCEHSVDLVVVADITLRMFTSKHYYTYPNNCFFVTHSHFQIILTFHLH